MIAGISVYQLCWYFMLYAILGWITEVIFQAVKKGIVVNRGFLCGPYCPIYGVGICLVLIILGFVFPGVRTSDIKLPFMFIFGTVFSTFIELLGGWLLDKIFHTRWWDYSKDPLNFHGYICALFCIIWGLAVVFVLKLIHPLFEDLVSVVPGKVGDVILIVFFAAFLADIIITVLSLTRIGKKLKILETMRSDMREVSDKVSTALGEEGIEATKKLDEEREALLNELSAHPVMRRHIKAFPNMISREHDELIKEIRNRVHGGVKTQNPQA